MAKYSIRDILGHFVKPKSEQGDLCHHACCRGRRVHPADFPVILPRRMLRAATVEELAEHLGRYDKNDRAATQVIREFDRRDAAERRKAAARGRAFSRKLERQEEVERQLLAAEAATNGNLVNKAGQRAGVTDVSLFTGPESRAMRYASSDLLRYWEDHPRPSAGLSSANPAVVRKARARSDIGRSEPRRSRSGGLTGYGIY